VDKYKFSIQDIEVVNPEGWKDFELRLKRDDDIAGLLISSTNKFTFKGDGYDLIKDRFDNNYNDKLTAKIEVLENNSYSEKYNGVIILTDVLFNLEKKTAQATIEDASFQGAIQANKNVKSFLNAGMTKNGEQVTTIQLYNLNYFIANGNYFTLPALADRKAYLLKDALDFMVRFMTDDIVKGVQSAYLDDTANFDGYLPYITTGEAIRLANSDAPNVSFSELITFLSKTYDLTFDFVTVSGEIVMRIEDRAFFFQSDVTDTFRDLTDLTLNIDAQKIASHLEVGNNTTADAGNCSLTTRFFSFQEEDYTLKGKGNVDKLIDLKTDFVTDSNVIQYIVTNFSDDEFDDNIVIVQAAYHQVAEPKYRAAQFQSTSYCSNNYYYNGSFTNDKIIDRNLNAIPNSITKYLTAATTPALAEIKKNIDGLFDIPQIIQLSLMKHDIRVNYDDEKYDLGSNYNETPNTYYDIPYSGKFSFQVGSWVWFTLTSIKTLYQPGFGYYDTYAAFISIHLSIERWNTNLTGTAEEIISTPVENFILNHNNIASLGTSNMYNNIFRPFQKTKYKSIAATLDCAAGEKIIARLNITLTHSLQVKQLYWNIKKSPLTYFECLGAEDDAGTYKVFNPNDFKARLYKFRKNVSLSRTDNIRDNTRSSLIINELSDTTLDKTVWIEEMVNNVETGETSFTMIN